MQKALIIAALVFGFATPAFAFHCPKDMAAIDAAMPNAKLSDADKAKVMELRKTGEAQHKAGDHASSVKTLAEAKKILAIK
ncbi:MAG: hypothetical protein ACR2PO_13140 [Methyloligellaceae bacterium]